MTTLAPSPTRSQPSNSSSPRTCRATDCERDARCAIRTLRNTRDSLQSTVFFDDRTAPRTAAPYCKEHGVEIMLQSMHLLVDPDA